MMQVSTKTEYGLRCLVLLARQAPGASLAISEIAEQEKLPRAYIQQILLKLRRSGIVKSIRGTDGGFALAMDPERISLATIVGALEGVPFEDTCSRFNQKADCGHLSSCSIQPIWAMVSRRLWETLEGITLRQLSANTVATRVMQKELPVLQP